MNITLFDIGTKYTTEVVMSNMTLTNGSSNATYELTGPDPWIVFPSVFILCVAAIVGTAGNVLTILSIVTFRNVRSEESVLLLNMAISDLFVTTIADPMSIMGK